ncbi:MAG TPA: hypothetical protein VF403_02775, partial [Kofleriaceae bacterium]
GMKVVPVSVGRPTAPAEDPLGSASAGSAVNAGSAATVGSGAGAVDPNPAGSAMLIPLPPDDN